MTIWRRDATISTLQILNSSQQPYEEEAQVLDEVRPHINLFEMSAFESLERRSGLAKDSNELDALEKVLTRARSHGRTRFLRTMPDNFRVDLDRIKRQFPNFSEVITYIRGCAEIAYRTDKVLTFTPVLLNGPGGVGKSMFSEALAKWMLNDLHRISISSSQNGSELAGSSSFFSNAKPGIPFTTLLYSSYANPIFFLDEIDKNSCSSYDALGALYVLLEPGTATTYTDQCYELPIDASHILYIAACNDASLLPDPLRTRFKQFDITISPNQSRQIAESIINSTFASMMPATEGMSVSSRAMDVLSTMTPRKIGQALTEAIGTAFAMGSTVIDHIAAAEPQKSRIGFLP